MRKTIALGIISIFVFSLIPLVFAEDHNNNTGPLGQLRDDVGGIKEVRQNLKDLRQDISKTRENIQNIRQNLTRKRPQQNLIKVRNAEDLNERIIPNSRIAELNVNFEKAREKYDESKKRLDLTRQELRDAIRKGNQNATLTHAKDYLLHTTDIFISHLEKLKTQIQENKNIPNVTEATIVADVDAQISGLNTLKAEIQDASTKAQLRDDAKKLQDKWKNLQQIIKLFTNRIVAARVEGIVNEGLVLEKRLDNILSKLNGTGVHVDVSVEVSQFSAKIADSRNKYKQAQDKLSAALDLRAAGEPAESDKIKTLVTDAQDLLKQSRESLKDAYNILKTIVKKIKEASPSADLSSQTEVEVEHETSGNGRINATETTHTDTNEAEENTNTTHSDTNET